jgi:glycosyltransferase involved in cell wall biosynthesis
LEPGFTDNSEEQLVKIVNQNTPDRRRRILLLTDIFGTVGGAERNITQLLIGIDKDKFDIYTACFVSGKLVESMRNQGFAITTLKEAGIYTISGLKNLAFLKRLATEKKICLIVTYHESSDFYGLALSRICHIPVISSRRDMGFKTALHYSLAYRVVGKYFDYVITVSDAVKREVIKRRWFPERKIFTIYNAIKTIDYGNVNEADGVALKRKLGIHPEYPVVGMVANMTKIKGHHYFLQAAAIICKYHPNVQFLIIGYEGKEPGFTIAGFERYGEEIGVSQSLHFVGGRTNVADLISIFDIAVLASLSEGFSNVILEYMASAKPVVATDVGGNPEVVVRGETGLLVPPGDPEALASAVLSMLGDKEMVFRFGMAGRRRVQERFSLDVMLRNYENLFEQVVNSRRDNSPVMFT